MLFLSIFKNVESNVPPTPEHMATMAQLIEDAKRRGELIATAGCLPSVAGARVRRDGAKVTVKDGPFSESKEVIGGFAILQADSKEQAIEMAKHFLSVAGDGECEVRQIIASPADFEAFAGAGVQASR